MNCSKVVICNRSIATGKDIKACLGTYEDQARCPEWIAAISLEKIAKATERK